MEFAKRTELRIRRNGERGKTSRGDAEPRSFKKRTRSGAVSISALCVSEANDYKTSRQVRKVREVLKISLRSLRSLRLNIFGGTPGNISRGDAEARSF